jgi:hypothetical protein
LIHGVIFDDEDAVSGLSGSYAHDLAFSCLLRQDEVGFIGFDQGELNPEQRAFAGCAFDSDAAAHQLDEFPRD